jgi:hypothetical protein
VSKTTVWIMAGPWELGDELAAHLSGILVGIEAGEEMTGVFGEFDDGADALGLEGGCARLERPVDPLNRLRIRRDAFPGFLGLRRRLVRGQFQFMAGGTYG